MPPEASEGLQRTDSLIKRSNLIGADDSAGAAQRILLPYPDSDFDLSQDDSNVPSGHSSSSSRSHSLASRFRSSRLLGSGMLKPGKRGVDESMVSSSNSLALLGPSRQLAGVVASMSTLPTDSGTSPSSAAALASAVAVAGATGSWQQPHSLIGSERPPVRPRVESIPEKVPPARSKDESHEPDPPMRYVPPAASVAAGMYKCAPLIFIILRTGLPPSHEILKAVLL
ncbi:unnamed protein product [Echinostoma caproni]|uniref:Uncharacterized protein n=1 Tax=Echinostoma caproni TaxID=27848 RepID=A0A183B1Y2_9TREM|nr:unnamed protein product [Echinostoma caproni]